MSRPVSDLRDMLAGMEPVMRDEHGWEFKGGWDGQLDPAAFAIIREAEGLTVILPAGEAKEDRPSFARITLQVHSDLEGVGLTAAVASALAENGIACNVIAAFHHDHVFVPWARRDQALAILKQLSQDARR